MRSLLVALVRVSLVLAAFSAPSAQVPKKIVEVEDGDVILVKDPARVRIVRRAEGSVRAIFNPQQHSLIIFLDQASTARPADGRVDTTFTFQEVEGEWPLGERWEGRATVDEYVALTGMVSFGLGLNGGSGFVQILSGARGPGDTADSFKDASATATVRFSRSSRGGGGNETFDEAESRQGAGARRMMSAPAAGLPLPPPSAPVRVGGILRTPMRVEDAEPVMPEAAQRAGVRGVVVVEIIIGADGRVSDAKILRSIPLLDAAALETARKWRYEPTVLNGAPVPIIMTATVNFR